jgi:tetratricopeptide (TPR) repeat protein
MPASVILPAPDPPQLSESDGRALVRFLEQGLDQGFRLAIVEAAGHADREAILAAVAPTIGAGLLRVGLGELPGADANVWAALRDAFAEHKPRCLALWGIEGRSHGDWLGQLNVQRDLFVRDLAVPWLLFIHPASRVQLLQAAPDFCDFAILWLRDERAASEMGLSGSVQIPERLRVFSSLVVRDPLLKRAQVALDAAQFNDVADLLSRFDLQPEHDIVDGCHRQLLGARLEREQGQLASAEAILREARSSLEGQTFGPELQNLMLEVDAELGRVLHQAGRYSEAETLLHRAVKSVEATVGREHPSFGASQQALASVMLEQGKYTEAERLLRDSVAIADETLGRAHTSYGDSLQVLARALSKQGRYAEAEHLLRESVAINEKALGREHPSYGASLHELASVLAHQGRYVEAERLLRDALGIKEKVLGDEHPAYGASLHELARMLSKQGKYGEAERLLRGSLAITEKALGREHPSHSASMHELANILLRQGDSAQAERLLRNALAINERALGRDHPAYGASLNELASVRLRQGDQEEAERLFRESHAIAEKALGREHPSYATAVHNLAAILLDRGEPADAERMFHEALAIKEKALGPEHPALCSTLAWLATIAADQGRAQEAINLVERALRIGRATMGADHPEVQSNQRLLQSLRFQGVDHGLSEETGRRLT